jgi:purine-binding chemotaxis protein CheW
MAETSEQTAAARSAAGKYLTFVLGGEEYGIDILSVMEIIGMMEITAVPQTPRFVKGVVNLRGKVIPVVDLRLKFGMREKEPTKETCIVVVEVDGLQMGVMVDTVREVLDIGAEQIEPAPRFGTAVDTAFIDGMAKVDDRVKILLDIEKVLSTEDLELVSGLGPQEGTPPAE